ncbi:glycoside hydrolase family 16 protein, partial [Ascoidea rubescens DSM 1968]
NCNPLKDENCKPLNVGLSTSIIDYFEEKSPNYSIFIDRGSFTFHKNDGLEIIMDKRYDNPSIRSNFYILYGKVEAIIKTSSGQGIISSFFLQSDDGDEIDIEWIGGERDKVQTNFFSKGNVTTYSRGQTHKVIGHSESFHKYTIDWKKEELNWYIDDKLVRSVKNNTDERYPCSAMSLMVGIWAGGDPGNEVGTIQWAGGETDFDKAPFSMFVKRIVVSDYSSGSFYKYSSNYLNNHYNENSDNKGIEIVGGNVNDRFEIASKEFSIL